MIIRDGSVNVAEPFLFRNIDTLPNYKPMKLLTMYKLFAKNCKKLVLW